MAITFVQESVLPKLTQTSLFSKFDEASEIRKAILSEINNASNIMVKPSDIEAVLSLMSLNGGPLIKKALALVKNGTIVILNNTETTDVPISLPFLILTKGEDTKAFVFADKIVNNINSDREYDKLMAVIEASYVALQLFNNDSKFIQNRQLMLTLCEIYTKMTVFPIEQKAYMKGENLVKALVYVTAFFYKMIDGENFDIKAIVKRIVGDQNTFLTPEVIKQISDEVRSMETNSIMTLIEMIMKINPVRYENLNVLYLNYFTTVSGASLIFALENLAYLFVLISSSNYRTTLTNFNLNKLLSSHAKKVVQQLLPMLD